MLPIPMAPRVGLATESTGMRGGAIARNRDPSEPRMMSWLDINRWICARYVLRIYVQQSRPTKKGGEEANRRGKLKDGRWSSEEVFLRLEGHVTLGPHAFPFRIRITAAPLSTQPSTTTWKQPSRDVRLLLSFPEISRSQLD